MRDNIAFVVMAGGAFLFFLGASIALCQIARVNQALQALSDRIWR